ncbi:metal ABC transporter solute-binding protein, Zn/Mn family [Planctomonas psychrotolerans]|uniref:metal ABC transporter solute-binding protein, Zn/Mn family n=1 Tax=Planctomonas psychrotolerans TaxID=2528712 RepID=UPI00123BF4D0|nr:zinc ABC transporter substrate-binding protein [Planctomonas psychrotolerans]
MKRSLTAVPLLLGSLVLAGCSGTPAGGATGTVDETDRPTVVVTTTQIADFTRAIAGDSLDVTQLIQPNQSAHGYEPSAADLLAMADADAVVQNGIGLEEWLDSAVNASGFDGVLIDASEGIAVADLAGGAEDEHAEDAHAGEGHTEDEHAGEGHAEDEHAGEGHAEDDHAHDDHAGETEAEHAEHADEAAGTEATDADTEAAGTEGTDTSADEDHAHDHSAGDPHIWSDPANAITMVESIAAGLTAVDGVDAEAVEANAAAYIDDLSTLADWIDGSIEAVPAESRLLVTNHDTFGYFAERYDVHYVGSVIPGFDDNAEPSAAEIDQLVAAIRETGTTAIFAEASISPRTAETIATEAGVTVYAGDDALYADSLGPAGSAGETYIASQVHNVTLLVESWGAAPLEVPAQLEVPETATLTG